MPAAGASADLGARFVAKLIDWAIGIGMFIVVFIVALILGSISDALGLIVGILGYLVALAAVVFIFGWGLGETGQTPGKRLQGLQVVETATGRPMGGPKGIGRLFLEGIINSFCYINWIWALIDSDNQTLADKVLTANVVPGPKGGVTPLFPGGTPF